MLNTCLLQHDRDHQLHASVVAADFDGMGWHAKCLTPRGFNIVSMFAVQLHSR